MPIFYNWTVDRSGAGIRVRGVSRGADGVFDLGGKVLADRVGFDPGSHKLLAFRGDDVVATLSFEHMRDVR